MKGYFINDLFSLCNSICLTFHFICSQYNISTCSTSISYVLTVNVVVPFIFYFISFPTGNDRTSNLIYLSVSQSASQSSRQSLGHSVSQSVSRSLSSLLSLYISLKCYKPSLKSQHSYILTL